MGGPSILIVEIESIEFSSGTGISEEKTEKNVKKNLRNFVPFRLANKKGFG